MDSVKITQFEAQNFKRVRAVQLTPTATGLTIIGGDNNQGKTSVLDAIAWALGGERFRPSTPTREGSVIPPNIQITLSNGLTVERSGKNGTLKVTDPTGKKGGQQLLNEFVETFALDLPKFMHQSSKEKAQTLLQILGIGDQLMELDRQESEKYNSRLEIGRIADRKKKHADELPYWPGVPEQPVSASELIRQQQEILARNGENQRKRQRAAQIQLDYNRQFGLVTSLESQLKEGRAKLKQLEADLATATKDAVDLQDESTAELEENLKTIDTLNAKIRQNLDKANADDEAKQYTSQYDALTREIETIRARRMALLDNADMPLPGLSVQDGEITYKGQKWDNMSGSEQLRAATAIVRKLNPACGFVLLDALEAMDMITLKEFGAWLNAEGLQAIATRVSTGDECSLIIEDGYVKGEEIKAVQPVPAPAKWKKGEF